MNPIGTPREQSLTERKRRLEEARKAISDEIAAIDGEIAAERVRRIAALDARIAAREEEERREAARARNPVHPALSHEERADSREAS
jgi:hypothetical protein